MNHFGCWIKQVLSTGGWGWFPCSGSWNNIKTHSGHDTSLAIRWRRSRYTNIWLSSLWENSDCAVLPGWDCCGVSSLWDRPLCPWGRMSEGSREHWSLSLEKLRMFGYPTAHLVPHFLCNIHDCLSYYFSEVFLIYQRFPTLALHQNHLVGGRHLQKQRCQGPTLQRFWLIVWDSLDNGGTFERLPRWFLNWS